MCLTFHTYAGSLHPFQPLLFLFVRFIAFYAFYVFVNCINNPLLILNTNKARNDLYSLICSYKKKKRFCFCVKRINKFRRIIKHSYANMIYRQSYGTA